METVIHPHSPLPMPDGRPVPCFFGRRFLTANEVIATGLVRNRMTLARLIAEGRFPAPLLLGRKLRLWDCLELQQLIDRLAAERDTDLKARSPGVAPRGFRFFIGGVASADSKGEIQ